MEVVEGAGSSQDFGGKVPGGKENLWWSFRRLKHAPSSQHPYLIEL